jgi:hypothetical protein
MMIALTLTCASCAPLSVGKSYFAQATPVCNLISDQQRYVGQRVLVTGLYDSTPRGGLLYGPKCEALVWLSGASDVPDDERSRRVIEAAFIQNKSARVPVVVSGIFQLRLDGPHIESVTFVAARQP